MAERIVRVMSKRTRKVHLAYEEAMTLVCGTFFKSVWVSPDDEPITCQLCLVHAARQNAERGSAGR